MQRLEDYGYRTADSVVSVLPAAGPHMVERGMDPARFHYLPNGIDLDGARRSGDAPAAIRDAVGPGAFTVGFVGTLGTSQRAGDADRRGAAGRSRRGAGGRRRPRAGAIASSCERAAGARNVAFVGPIPKGDVPAALQLFDACYVGYRRSSLYRFGVSPNKLYDYMAAGRPVLFAADAANQPVQEADCGLTVAPEDPAALAGAISSLATASEAERRAPGRQRARLRRAPPRLPPARRRARRDPARPPAVTAHAELRRAMAELIGVPPDHVTLFWKGRVAFYAILRALGVGPGDEVIVPAFTCVAVPNAILYTGATPVYVDIDEASYTADPAAVAAALSPRTSDRARAEHLRPVGRRGRPRGRRRGRKGPS